MLFKIPKYIRDFLKSRIESKYSKKSKRSEKSRTKMEKSFEILLKARNEKDEIIKYDIKGDIVLI